jgi:glucokinase
LGLLDSAYFFDSMAQLYKNQPLHLLADIGGTNVRFGLLECAHGTIGHLQSMAVADHVSPEAAALHYLGHVLAPHQRMALKQATWAIAAPVLASNACIGLTNHHWQIDRAAITQALQLDHLQLLNDFEALAMALPYLQAPQELRFLGAGQVQPNHTKAVIGPGTGLGVAACLMGPQGWQALATEGGHASLCAVDDFEVQLLQAAQKILSTQAGPVSAEQLLSGSGLPVLYQAVCWVQGWGHEALTPAQITHSTTQNAATRLTLDTFCALLGTFAGNAALTLGARGGVYLGGGLSALLANTLVGSRFRDRFETRGRFSAYMDQIQTAIITAPYVALKGLAEAAGFHLSGHD